MEVHNIQQKPEVWKDFALVASCVVIAMFARDVLAHTKFNALIPRGENSILHNADSINPLSPYSFPERGNVLAQPGIIKE